LGGDVFSEESDSNNEQPEEESEDEPMMTLEEMVEKGRQLIAADRAADIYTYTDPFPASENREEYINNNSHKIHSLERFNLNYHATSEWIRQNPDKVTPYGNIKPGNVQHEGMHIGTWLHSLKTRTMKKERGTDKYYKILHVLYILPQGQKIVRNCY
jgi:hypothetical protein